MPLARPDATVHEASFPGRSPVGLTTVLEALPTCAALLERGGTVVAANEPWRRFHAEHGAPGAGLARNGADLDACLRPASGEAATNDELCAGLRAVLAGECESFERERVVEWGDTKRWYRLVVRRVADESFDGAIALLLDLTAEHELRERHHRTQVELERRVMERTAALSRANVLLQYEIGERRRASAERNQLLEEVRLERKLLSAVLTQMPLGVMIAEPKTGRVVLHNDQLVRLVGKAVRSHPSALLAAGGRAYHPDGRPFRDDDYPLVRALRGETIDGEEIEFERADGVRIVLRASAVPVRDEPGELIAAVVALYDVTQWKEAERQLRQSETRYRLASRAINDAIWDVDFTTDRIEWSEGITTAFGYPLEAVGEEVSWWLDHIAPEDRKRVRADLDAALASDVTLWQADYRFLCHDGRYVDVMDRGFIVRDASGRAVRAVGAMEDVSERRRAEAERAALLERERQARADAEAANRAKDEFLAVVSHELRTPLSPILGFVDMLREDDLSELDRRAALNAIERNARSLSYLIDDLLDVSRITSGKLSLEFAECDVNEIVAAVVESAGRAALAKDLRLTVRLADDPVPVHGDAARLTQVLANLLSNALKFTPAGGAVEVDVVRQGTRVNVSVRDTGKGITRELLPHVFERFRQGDTSDTRVHGGLGLGLAIVCHIVDLHGGAAAAESAGEGRGATFTVVLPLLQHHAG